MFLEVARTQAPRGRVWLARMRVKHEGAKAWPLGLSGIFREPVSPVSFRQSTHFAEHPGSGVSPSSTRMDRWRTDPWLPGAGFRVSHRSQAAGSCREGYRQTLASDGRVRLSEDWRETGLTGGLFRNAASFALSERPSMVR